MIFPLIEPRLRRHADRFLLLAVGLLMLFSVATIYYAKGGMMAPALRQGLYFVVGLVLLFAVAAQDYARLTRFAPLLYWGNIVLLLLVLTVAPDVKGASRWIPLPIPGVDFKLQPSEFAKIVIILTLSSYVTRLGTEISTFPGLMKSLVHIALPVGLIMAQPDLGTSLVFVAIWLGVVFLAGAKIRHLIALGLAGALLFGVAWQTNILKDYQKRRVEIFLNPYSDPKGAGYHILQSQTAIGGGQVTGQGVGKGLQTRGRFIPENNTDFIFTVVGEESGFVGACVLLCTYGLFFYRGIVIIADSEDPLGRLIAGGVITLFVFHVGVNIGMTCGVAPVVGVPLPLMSFGGSAAWANLIAVGLLLSISMRRHKIQF